MSGSNPDSDDVERLKQANERLKTENARLRSQLDQRRNARARGWRGPVALLCALLAAIILMISNVIFWAGDTLVNNERYVKASTPVLQDDAVQAAVANYAARQIFQNVDVNKAVQDALPPRADFLSGTLTAQLQKGTEQTLKKLVAGDRFQTVWVQANSRAHQRLISSIKNSNGDGVLDLQEVYKRLGESLHGTKLNFLADKSLPPKIASIEVVHAEWVPKARSVINSIGWIKPVSLLLVALFSALSIWLSRSRRRTVLLLGAFFAGSMFISLVVFRLIHNNIVGHFAPIYQTAADHAAHAITSSLILQTTTILLVSLLVVFVAWLTGPYRAAAATRGRVSLLFSGRLHEAIFASREEPAFTRWAADRKRLLQWLAVGAVGAIMLVVRLTPKLVLMYGLITLLVVLLIETIARPSSSRKTR